MIARFLLVFGIAFALAGCAVAPAPEGAGPQGGASYAPANHAEPGQRFSETAAALCRTSGGTIEARGRMQTEYCLHALADAGKVCSDKSDCTGKCVSSDTSLAAGVPAAGKCQADNGPLFGCYAEVQGGKATAAVCVD